MPDLRRVCVFCASSPGSRPLYGEVAAATGALLAANDIGVVYGGGAVGLMGIVADAALAAGGEVTGVIPDDLFAREVGHAGVSDLRVVASMHERKQLMFDLADGFVALPGGLGTLEEVFEVLTWAQLGMHVKPIAVLDVAGYYEPLLAFLDRAVDERLVRAEHRRMLLHGGDPAEVLERMRGYQPPVVEKWIDRGDT